MTDSNDPLGAAQQSPPEETTPQVQKQIKEETKEPEPSQTVEPTGGVAMNAPSVGALPRLNQQPIQTAQQSADAI